MFNNFSFIAYCLAKGFTTAMDEMVDRDYRHHCHHQWKHITNSCDCMKNSNQDKIKHPQSEKNQSSCSQSREINKSIMSLNEAIRHAEEKGQGTSMCSKNHRQLALWLKELKRFRASNILPYISHDSETITSQIENVYNEQMSLDEVIKYADQKAGNRETYMEKQYSQIACWLTELKWRRVEDKKRLENDYAILRKEAKPIDEVFKEEDPSRPSSNKATIDDEVKKEVIKLIKALTEEVKQNKQNADPPTSNTSQKSTSKQINSIPGFEGTITSNE